MMTTKKRMGGPYDEQYAEMYNDIWYKNPVWKVEGKFHIQTIAELIKPEGTWLDVGCGTGFLLSNFPDCNRMGLDLSEAMLKQAKKCNPDVRFVQQSMAEENSALEGAFDLVTCTGQPWSYLTSMDTIEKAVSNLAKWTAKDGKCMLTPIDISDVMDHQLSPVYDLSGVPNETPIITGILWDYKELDTVYHNCLSPNLDQWIRWFSVHFHKVEIFRWPHEPEFLLIPRRVIVCSEKREVGDQRPPVIIEHPVPGGVRKQQEQANTPTYLSNKQLLGELGYRVKSGILVRAAVQRLFGKK